MHCDHGSGMGHSKALQLHCSGLERNSSLLWLASSPNAGQYFQRLGGCSRTSPQKRLRFPPLHNSRIRAALPRRAPGSIFHHFEPKFTPFFTLSDTLFRFYFYTSQIPAPLRWSVSSEHESSSIPQRNVSPKCACKTLLIS